MGNVSAPFTPNETVADHAILLPTAEPAIVLRLGVKDSRPYDVQSFTNPDYLY